MKNAGQNLLRSQLSLQMSWIVSSLIRVTIYASLVLTCCFIQKSTAEKTISFAVSEFPPYISKELKNYGFTSEIVTEAFSRAGYTVKTSFMPWQRALLKVAEGKYDAAYPAYYSQEREQTYAFSKPFATGPIGFYIRKDTHITYKTLHDLQPYTIGVVRGYVNTPEFDAATYLRKDMADDDEQNLRKLVKKRVDLIIIDKFTAQYILNTVIPEAKTLLEFLEPPLEVKQFHLLVSKSVAGYQQTLQDFHHNLQQMLEDGTIARILKQHGFE